MYFHFPAQAKIENEVGPESPIVLKVKIQFRVQGFVNPSGTRRGKAGPIGNKSLRDTPDSSQFIGYRVLQPRQISGIDAGCTRGRQIKSRETRRRTEGSARLY